MTSVSQAGSRSGSVSSTASRGRIILHKIKRIQNTISAKAKALEKALGTPGIEGNPRAVAKAGIVWATIEHMRCGYQTLLDEACESVGEAEIEVILKVDDTLWDSLTEIEAKMEELLIMKDSPEKAKKEDMDKAFTTEKKHGEFSQGDRGLQEFLYNW